MASTVVDPMEVFASMTASLLEKQPKPFNPMYAIKPAPPHKLKVGGKPPREVFYRDTLIFMTSLPPPVQSKLCTCKYLCNGDAASIICHSCSIYDPTKAAYYCSKCFPTRHPWYRVPHLHTVIENDESISHTLKVAHRIAEASRYDNEGKGILRKIQNQKPNLAFVADDEKVDNQLREYGRKVTALEDHVLQLRERLRRDIIHGDVIPQRRSLYTNSETDVARGQHLIRMSDESSDLIDSTPTSGTLLDSTRAESATNNSAESTNPEEDGGGEAGGDQTRTKLEQLRRQPIFDSEPLFTSLQESERFDESAPETVGGSGGGWNRADVRKLALTERSPFLRGDTADSADSMTFSPDEGGSFFREDSNFNIARSAGPHLQAIEETDSVVTEPTEAGISPTRQDTTTAVVATTAPLNPQLSLSENPEVTSAAIFPPTGNNDSAAPQWDQVALTEEAEEKGTSLSSPGGLRRVLSGISFTSVAHSDIDSVHPHSFNQHHHEPYLHVTPFGQQTAAATAAATASSSSDPRDRPAPLSGNSNEERTHQHQSKQEQPSLSAKLRSAQSANWLSSIASVEEASLEGSISTMGSSSAASDSDVSSLSKSSISIQRIFKGYLARRTVSKMLTTRLMRVFSLEANRDYYYDRITGATSWLPPKMLHADHLEELEYAAEQTEPKLWVCKRLCTRHRPTVILKRKVAAKVLHGFARCILARQRVLARADVLYRRVYDSESGAYYYANVYSGTTAWAKSKVYLHASSEPPLLQSGEVDGSYIRNNSEMDPAAATAAAAVVSAADSSTRRSPRFNRVS